MQDDIAEQLQSLFLEPELPLTYDTLQRCRVEEDKGRSRSGWYILSYITLDNGDTATVGAYGNWRLSEKKNISLKGIKTSPEEKQRLKKEAAERKKQFEAERKKKADQAANKAWRLWNRLHTSGDSDYLKRKQIAGYGLRYGNAGTIIIPMHNGRSQTVGLQVIYPDKQSNGRDKDFWPVGLEKKGASYQIGEAPGQGDDIILCEGYATGASIYLATGITTVVAFDCNNLLPVARTIKARYPAARIIVAGDDDYKTRGNPGSTKANLVAEKISGLAILPKFKTRPEDEKWTDFNDLHVNEGIEAVKEQFERLKQNNEKDPWQRRLSTTESGKIIPNMSNTQLILSKDERWSGVISYCEFSYRLMKARKPPTINATTGEWKDIDTENLRTWLHDTYRMEPKTSEANSAVIVAAHKNKKHPVRDYLNSLKWDHQTRLNGLLSNYFGTTDSQYTQLVSVKWMLGAVARIMQVPVKVDSVLILEGPQGLGKSTSLDILGGKWYSDTHFALGDKEGYQQLQGVWICELAELDSFNKAESTKAKQFFASKIDRFRVPYGRFPQDFPRQSVFAGTTNQDSYLKDSTGNRRYWPVYCEKIDMDALTRDRDQLWAEAVHFYNQGEIWWPSDAEIPLFEKEQEKRFDPDPWQTIIEDWLNIVPQIAMYEITSAEILEGAIKMQPHLMQRYHQMRIGSILKILGWEKKRVRRNGSLQNVYIRPVKQN